jgi:hypothetical protein
MAKKRTGIHGNRGMKTNNDSGMGCLALLGIFSLAALIIYTCSESDEDKSVNDVSDYARSYSRAFLKSNRILGEIHSKTFQDSEERNEIPEMTLGEISEIHHYLCIERWNTGGQIGMRWGTNYEDAAEDLNVPVSKLAAADNYYHYRLLPELTNVIREVYYRHPNIVIDHYSPLSPTAYCGMNTIIGGITVYGRKKTTDLREEAKKVAGEFANDLPDWVTGFKLHYTTYEDTTLQTQGDVNIGFLWRRGEDIQIMRAIRGTFGYRRPSENRNWHNDEWNDLKIIGHPSYSYIKR